MMKCIAFGAAATLSSSVLARRATALRRSSIELDPDQVNALISVACIKPERPELNIARNFDPASNHRGSVGFPATSLRAYLSGLNPRPQVPWTRMIFAGARIVDGPLRGWYRVVRSPLQLTRCRIWVSCGRKSYTGTSSASLPIAANYGRRCRFGD